MLEVSNLLACVLTDTAVTPDSNGKAFEVAASLAQSLVQWALALFGGSVLILLNTSYRRPGKSMRWAYLLFLPAWGLLAASVYYGINVQRVQVSFLFLPKLDIGGLRQAVNRDAYHQIEFFEMSLVLFGLWLLLYLFWWVFHKYAE